MALDKSFKLNVLKKSEGTEIMKTFYLKKTPAGNASDQNPKDKKDTEGGEGGGGGGGQGQQGPSSEIKIQLDKGTQTNIVQTGCTCTRGNDAILVQLDKQLDSMRAKLGELDKVNHVIKQQVVDYEGFNAMLKEQVETFTMESRSAFGECGRAPFP